MAPRQTGVQVNLDHDERGVLQTISVVRRALMLAEQPAGVAAEYTEAALRCRSYDELLRVTNEWVKAS